MGLFCKLTLSESTKSVAVACGRATEGIAQQLVLNGERTDIETVPWHAAIYLEIGSQKAFSCGGSLVSPCFVVTGADTSDARNTLQQMLQPCLRPVSGPLKARETNLKVIHFLQT